MLAAADRRGIVAGYAIAALFRAALTWVVITAVALLAGMNVDGCGVDSFGLYGLAVFVNAASMWAAGVAMRVRSIQGGPLDAASRSSASSSLPLSTCRSTCFRG